MISPRIEATPMTARYVLSRGSAAPSTVKNTVAYVYTTKWENTKNSATAANVAGPTSLGSRHGEAAAPWAGDAAGWSAAAGRRSAMAERPATPPTPPRTSRRAWGPTGGPARGWRGAAAGGEPPVTRAIPAARNRGGVSVAAYTTTRAQNSPWLAPPSTREMSARG